MVETSTTDQSGLFRIRGLQPKQKYAFYVNLETDRNFLYDVNIAFIYKATPQKIEALVHEKDIYSIDFLTLKFQGDIAVSGVVNFEGEGKPE